MRDPDNYTEGAESGSTVIIKWKDSGEKTRNVRVSPKYSSASLPQDIEGPQEPLYRTLGQITKANSPISVTVMGPGDKPLLGTEGSARDIHCDLYTEHQSFTD